MAQFRGSIKGQRGEASRLGSKFSGMVADVNGWDAGIRVMAQHSDGHDLFQVYATGGSNDKTVWRLLGELSDGKWLPLTDLEIRAPETRAEYWARQTEWARNDTSAEKAERADRIAQRDKEEAAIAREIETADANDPDLRDHKVAEPWGY